jgi:hypothetical protein
MEMTKHAEVGLFLFALTASGLALADCPRTMPVQLLEDCIVYEGAGSSFPPSDYVYIDQYQDWLKTQQPLVLSQPTRAPTARVKQLIEHSQRQPPGPRSWLSYGKYTHGIPLYMSYAHRSRPARLAHSELLTDERYIAPLTRQGSTPCLLADLSGLAVLTGHRSQVS